MRRHQGKIPYKCRVYESVDDKSLSWDISQKLTENTFHAACTFKCVQASEIENILKTSQMVHYSIEKVFPSQVFPIHRSILEYPLQKKTSQNFCFCGIHIYDKGSGWMSFLSFSSRHAYNN